MELDAVSTTRRGFSGIVCEETVGYSLDHDPISFEWGRHALLDWLGVTIAGSCERSAVIAADYARAEGCPGPSTLIGRDERLPPSLAAMVNAVAAHALDFDDSSSLVGGHPSAPIVSAAVAVAEREGASAVAVIEAVAAGIYSQALIFGALGRSGYERGFHTTATFGTFGAAAACGRLLDVDAATLHRAFGLAATQAAGVKASFGTMGKHLNAGKAAANGLLSVELASRGFAGTDDAIEARQGFAWTHSDDLTPDDALSELRGVPAIRSLNFKQHACCHGTHSAIEGARDLVGRRAFDAVDIVSVDLTVSSAAPDVCGIHDPQSGLEGKFSLRYVTALALLGLPTGPRAFTDAAVAEARVRQMMDRIVVIPTPDLSILEPSEVRVWLGDGTQHRAAVDIRGTDDVDLPRQWQRLVQKFDSLVEPVVGRARAREMVHQVATLEQGRSVHEIVRSTS